MMSLFSIRSRRVCTEKGLVHAVVVVDSKTGTINDIIYGDVSPAGVPCTDFGDLVIMPGEYIFLEKKILICRSFALHSLSAFQKELWMRMCMSTNQEIRNGKDG